jgi:hypothetical protein
MDLRSLFMLNVATALDIPDSVRKKLITLKMDQSFVDNQL